MYDLTQTSPDKKKSSVLSILLGQIPPEAGEKSHHHIHIPVHSLIHSHRQD